MKTKKEKTKTSKVTAKVAKTKTKETKVKAKTKVEKVKNISPKKTKVTNNKTQVAKLKTTNVERENKMNNINSINSVDFKIEASGYGVVNWNGSVGYKENFEGKIKVNENLTLPKLRGFSPIREIITKEGEKRYINKTLEEIEHSFTKHDMYISSNCIRHYLFKDEINFANELGSDKERLREALKSVYGLVRGYVSVSAGNLSSIRKSPLLIEDFVDSLRNGNIETFVQSGEKNKNSYFFKATYGETKYSAYGSINIEDLQFISLDDIFGRCAFKSSGKDYAKLANEIGEFITSLSKDGKVATVTYSEKYVRNGTVHQTEEAGLLMDNNAISILVEEILHRIKTLFIRNKGSMRVTNVTIDYNNSSFFRIKDNEEEINTAIGDMEYTQYYSEVK